MAWAWWCIMPVTKSMSALVYGRRTLSARACDMAAGEVRTGAGELWLWSRAASTVSASTTIRIRRMTFELPRGVAPLDTGTGPSVDTGSNHTGRVLLYIGRCRG